ncbi:MAG: aminotransferase class V-fold PLP-dependent enzyme [Oscillospiraceae bacterium]
MIYFDNAATTYPKPPQVGEMLKASLELYGGNPGRSGHKISMDTAMMVYNCREIVSQTFGCEPEDVVFTQNCTMASNFALQGILEFGDHVLISDLEHNSTARPIYEMYTKGIISYDVVPTFFDDKQTIKSFEKLIKPTTKLISCTHGSNVFGTKLPIEGIARLAKKHGIYMMVDAAQTAGIMDINMKQMGIDFLCTAGHKGLYGPAGTGLLITPYGERLETIMQGGTGSNSLELTQPLFMPDRLESGTVNVPGIAGLYKGIEFVTQKGTENIYRHEMELTQYICSRLWNTENIIMYTPKLTAPSLPVISFNIKGITGEQTAAMLNEKGIAIRGGYQCAFLAHQKMNTIDSGTARISIGVFNTMQQAEKLCDEIKNLTYSLNKS